MRTTGNAQVTPAEPAEARAVFAMTNDASDNKILVYHRSSNGLLTFERSVSTHGKGSGPTVDPLESQGSLALSGNGSFLFAANGNSNCLQLWPKLGHNSFFFSVINVEEIINVMPDL